MHWLAKWLNLGACIHSSISRHDYGQRLGGTNEKKSDQNSKSHRAMIMKVYTRRYKPGPPRLSALKPYQQHSGSLWNNINLHNEEKRTRSSPNSPSTDINKLIPDTVHIFELIYLIVCIFRNIKVNLSFSKLV